MRFTLPVWESAYQHDRRQHRHRCRCCKRILEAGDAVIMARVGGRKTWALHKACASVRHSDSYTYGEVLRVWAFRYQIGCYGFRYTEPKHYAEIEKRRLACDVPAH